MSKIGLTPLIEDLAMMKLQSTLKKMRDDFQVV